jgi:hypothetical protein
MSQNHFTLTFPLKAPVGCQGTSGAASATHAGNVSNIRTILLDCSIVRSPHSRSPQNWRAMLIADRISTRNLSRERQLALQAVP